MDQFIDLEKTNEPRDQETADFDYESLTSIKGFAPEDRSNASHTATRRGGQA